MKHFHLEPCAQCGKPAEEKLVNKPFCHGWVGCRACKNIIPWSGKGRMSVIDQWNSQQKMKKEEA